MSKQKGFKPKRIWRATSIFLRSPLDQNQRWKETYGAVYPIRLNGESFLYVDDPQQLNEFYSYHEQAGEVLVEKNHLTSYIPSQYDELACIHALPPNWLKSIQNYMAVAIAQKLEEGQHALFNVQTLLDQVCLWSMGYLFFEQDLRKAKSPSSQLLKKLILTLQTETNSPLPLPPKLSFLKRRRIKQKWNELYTQISLPSWQPKEWQNSSMGLYHVLSLCTHWSRLSSAMLQWSWILLTYHEEHLHQLQNELKDVLNDQTYHPQNLHQLPILHQTILEILRLYPPKWLYSFDLDPSRLEIDLPSIASTSHFLIHPFWIHRHSEIWKDPLTFDPSRFQNWLFASKLPWFYCPTGWSSPLSSLSSPTPQSFDLLYNDSKLTFLIHLLGSFLTTTLRRGSFKPSLDLEWSRVMKSIRVGKVLTPNLSLPSRFVLNPTFIHIRSERI